MTNEFKEFCDTLDQSQKIDNFDDSINIDSVTCPHCHCTSFKDTNIIFEDIYGCGSEIPVEYDIQCKLCGNIVWHFAYGDYTLIN